LRAIPSAKAIFGAALRALKERAEIDTIIEMPDGVWLEGAGDCI
jgi:hypothetical protein